MQQPAHASYAPLVGNLAADDAAVGLTEEPPQILLEVIPVQIVAMKPVDGYEALVVVALGENGSGARILSRITQKYWAELGLAEGQRIYAQVKYVSLGPGRGELEEYGAVTSDIVKDRFPHALRLKPPRSAVAKLDPAATLKPLPEPPLPGASPRGRGRRRVRRCLEVQSPATE